MIGLLYFLEQTIRQFVLEKEGIRYEWQNSCFNTNKA